MSDNEINQIMFKLGVIEAKLEILSKIQNDIDTLRQNGCQIGKSQAEEIKTLKETVNSIRSIWRKALLVMAGVGVGSVGIEKMIQKLLSALVGTE